MFRVFCIVFLFFSLVVSAQDYEVAITTVSVWIRATDKSGKPFTGLKQSDFDIFEDGQKVAPTCFEEASFSIAADPTTSVEMTQSQPVQTPDPSRKQIVFLMDLWNTSQPEFLHLKNKAAEFLTQISKNWDITLVSMIPGMLNIDVESTQDGKAIQAALDKMTANSSRDISALNNRRDLAARIQVARKLPNGDPRIVDEICGIARDFAIKEKSLSFQWMNSLKQLDRYMKNQPDTHKVVLLFSGGISSNPGKQYFDIVRDSDLMREYVKDDFEIHRQFPGCDDEGGLDLQKELKKMVGRLNRYNVTFYTVSSRGPINDLLETVRESDRRFNIHDLDFLKDYQDYLGLFADETGGVYFGNSLNFKRGFDTILNDLNHQYLICYKPPQHKKEGHHSIEVRAKPQGIKVRHREGYYD